MLAAAIRTFLGPTYHNRNHAEPCDSVLCSVLSEYDAILSAEEADRG